MGAIFLDLEGFENVPPIMLRRTLLELAAIRHAVKGARSIPLGQVLEDAGLPGRGRTASIILRAVAQNRVVFMDHPDMYRATYLDEFLSDDVVIECNMWLVAKWVAKAGGGDHVYSFDVVSEGIRSKMAAELDDSMAKLTSRLSECPLDPDPDPGFCGRR